MDFLLEERTTQLALSIIELCKNIKKDSINNPLISQLIRSGTSIGANYHEANAASSRKDFKNKIHICKKEAQETIYWLRLLRKSNTETEEDILKLIDETHQLVLIFGKIISTMNSKIK